MLASAARRYYDASNRLTAAAIMLGVATGRIYCGGGPDGLVAGVNVGGSLATVVVLTLAACHAWRHRAVVCAAAAAVAVTVVCVAVTVAARLCCANHTIVFGWG
jgi:hypothetical protein